MRAAAYASSLRFAVGLAVVGEGLLQVRQELPALGAVVLGPDDFVDVGLDLGLRERQEARVHD